MTSENLYNKPLVSIQILNWNRAEETQMAIASAYKQTYENIEVVLVDNGSTDNSIELSKQNFPDLNIISLDKNHGCPGGRNRGIASCNGDYIFYLDNDGVLHEEAVENAIKTILHYDNVGVVTGTIYDFKNVSEIDAQCKIRSKKVYEYNNFQGGICMHHKSIYETTGLYPEHFMYGAEEMYLTYKLFDNDYKIIKNESVVLWHKKSEIARNRVGEQLGSYFNKLYVAIVLYPLMPMLIFATGFVVRYNYYAFKKGFGMQFLNKLSRDYFTTIKKGLKARQPVSLNAYYKVKEFKI
ncbi:glycosyltransferase family 2 protein [Croceibacter atlanticus]|uniref:glycosyltransferase family 2 protein n=1 Tax=Croceibacter atlanticus TaxID=313588 RepID=UPI00249310B2|nr:glycosyltransferase [Croceibacter atlanticus]